MNSERKLAVLKAGIVPPQVVSELSRWGLELPEPVEVEEDRHAALSNIREAVESKETVELRMTDLDAMLFYNQNKKPGRLYYSIPSGTQRRTTFVDVTYARTPIGSYMIPWTSENIYELMLAEGTYLKPMGEARVHFMDVSELYYGEMKAFMVCVPIIQSLNSIDPPAET